MDSEISFKRRVRDVIVFNAEVYRDVFVEYDYLLFSDYIPIWEQILGTDVG